MNTPILDFVRAYAKEEKSRLHMPGHKGKSFLGFEQFDITEVEGADVLYAPSGIILESENNATGLFRTAHSFYSAEGSSLSIKAMLALVKGKGTTRILAARNAHKAFLYGCALLDMEVEWLYPEETSHLCACRIQAEELESRMQQLLQEEKKPDAVYVTSPDYLGNVLDIKGLAKVCRKYSVPLLVDNAHGAYLGFLNPSRHPIHLGATMCCDSAHKTLPVLTGGGYLHIAKDAPKEYLDNARRMLSLFASTSPSYLVLQSLDRCNRYLAEEYSHKLELTIANVNGTKVLLQEQGYRLLSGEPLKIVVDCRAGGFTGTALSAHLRKNGLEAEFADKDYVVMMFTPETTDADYERIKSAFKAFTFCGRDYHKAPEVSFRAEAKMSIREAMLAPCRRVLAEAALGQICAAPAVSCPPAIPIVISGEVINKEAIELFRYYEIDEVEVVIEK